MKKILFATTNQHKRDRFIGYYQPLGIKVVSIKDLGIDLEVEEDGKTPKENAIKKALTYYKETGMPTFAVDYGLYIEKFPPNKQPGLFVRRIYGDSREATDEEMLDYYIQELNKVGGKSKGKWISAIALVLKKGRVHTQEFSRETLFVSKRSSRITPGEPLNSIQIDPLTGKYFTDLAQEEWLELQEKREIGYIEFMKRYLGEINSS